ncbi:Nucleosome assembly protein (NAP) family protein [Babesia bovis T2Bo]|uniref:Nucleosome assembly protein n=1 Tax=Babesia bovis TaxID=5865 RepID=A7AVU7_BABBO|nr:Nucleosome assembly protein (NAP) family protein [Babesia bovis T2Bo]EDO05923.1 Nucleosome assembly protein (NAP) family protein [Babesia bovis T2Bo]BAN65766.1 nucleosome assembly protein [Babesia bovis]|eukprot:XP_001609491.1 nucleosome assembly protein [Babesia bovis T2Bo]
MKRSLEEGTPDGAVPEVYGDAVDTQALSLYMHDFDAVQKVLLEIDEECAVKQIELQREYDRKKQPHFKKRQEIIDKIPGFWAKAISHHPALSYLTTADAPILELLQKIDLEDNIDNNGSYKVTLTFTEEAREYMEPLVLTKHIVFTNDKDDVVECTKIEWKEGKSPIEVAQKARSDERCIDWSLFEWFTTEEWVNRPDFGEILRRELWHAPLAYYLDTVSVDFADDDYGILDDDEE